MDESYNSNSKVKERSAEGIDQENDQNKKDYLTQEEEDEDSSKPSSRL